MEYRWVQTGSLQTDSNITSLSWNLEGTRLLTGGELLQLWHQNIMPFQEEHSKFNVYMHNDKILKKCSHIRNLVIQISTFIL